MAVFRRLLGALALMAAGLGSAAWAQEAEAPLRPVWEVRPALGQFPARFAGADYRANVTLHCFAEAGLLVRCTPAEGASESFAARAIEAASQARLAALDQGGRPVEGRAVEVMIGFPIPMGLGPPPNR